MSILREICRAKKSRLAQLRREWSPATLAERVEYASQRRSLSAALTRTGPRDSGASASSEEAFSEGTSGEGTFGEGTSGEGTSVERAAEKRTADDWTSSEGKSPIRFLTEIKRASPSAGWIREHADAVSVARNYQAAGSAAISLLTEEEYFHGRLEDLPRVREVGLPVLMKDFFIDPYQVILARGMGADALLLIAAIDDVPMLREVRDAARELKLEVLLEVHNEAECDLVHYLEPELAGVNNRNLSSFEVSLETSERLFARLPADCTKMSESGIKTRDDVLRLAHAGYDGLLVGESLMRADDPGAALRALRGENSGENLS